MALSRLTPAAGRIALALALLVTAACGTDKTVAPKVLTTLSVTLPIASLQMGQTMTAAAAGADQDGGTIATGTIAWASSAPSVASVNATTGVVTAVALGTAEITATSGAKSGKATVTVVASPGIKINEVESNGGTPGDWVELFNPTSAAVDISGWGFRDNDSTHVIYKVPANTSIAAGGYYLLEEAAFGFGLGGADEARLYNAFGATVEVHAWTAHAVITYARCPNGSGAFVQATSSTKGAANDCSVPVKINEIESNGGTPGDWVELINNGASSVNLGGFVIKDNDDTHIFTIPAGTTLAAGAYLVVEEAALTFGLGAADAVRLFDAAGATVDSYTWTAHAATTYGRCANGTGAFVTTAVDTKGAANSCGGQSLLTWPGGAEDITTPDGLNVFQTNGSGLTYEGAAGGAPAVLWAARNGPGTIFRMIFSGGLWIPDPANGWSAGKALRYLDGTGNPDTEGVTFAAGGSAGGLYVSTERNNDASTISRNTILRFVPTGTATTLTATHEWNINSALPTVGANLGIEAITWVPDTYLTARGFFDEATGAVYNPANYPDHAAGLFFVGVEGNGNLYAFALNHTNSTFTRIATIATGFAGVMALEFDRELNYLWATCDDGCGNRHATLEISTAAGANQGRFVTNRVFDKPSGLPNINNEGFAIAPLAECAGGVRQVFWADDGETGGHTIRRGTITCTAFAPALTQWIAPRIR